MNGNYYREGGKISKMTELTNVNLNNSENVYSFYLDFNDEYAASLFTLVVRKDELIFLNEDRDQFWITQKSESGVLEFIKQQEKEIGEKHMQYWLEKGGGDQVKLMEVIY